MCRSRRTSAAGSTRSASSGRAEEPYFDEPEDRACSLARLAGRPPHRARHLGDEPVPALGQLGLTRELFGEQLLPDRDPLRPVRRAADWRRSSTASTRARASSSSGRRPASRFHARAAPTSRRSRPGSGWSCRACSTPSRRYAREVEWILLDGAAADAGARGRGALSAPLDEACRPGAVRRALRAARGGGRARRRARREASGCARPSRAATPWCSPPAGRSCPRCCSAAELLEEDEGVAAGVLCLSSPDRLYRGWRRSACTHLGDLTATRERVPPRASVAVGAARPPHRHGDRRCLALAGVHRRLSRDADAAAGRRPLRPVRQPARGLRGLPALAGGDRHGGAHRAGTACTRPGISADPASRARSASG